MKVFATGMMMSLSVSLPNDGLKETDKLMIVRLRISRKEADFAIVTTTAEQIVYRILAPWFERLKRSGRFSRLPGRKSESYHQSESCRYHVAHMLVVDSLSQGDRCRTFATFPHTIRR
jgi:hypothetical protein